MLTIEQVRKIEKRKTFFKSSTFGSKLLMNLPKEQINPIITYLQILHFEPVNRTRKDILKIIPWLVAFQPFYSFITHKEENKKNINNTFFHFSTVLHHQYIKQNLLFKQVGDKVHYFYLIITGTVEELYLIFNKETLTDEEYFVHLIKLQLLHENEIAKRIMNLNSEVINFHQETIEQYINTKTKLNYSKLLNQAKELLLMLNIKESSPEGSAANVETYMKGIAVVMGDNSNNVQGNSNINNLKLTIKSSKDKRTFLIPYFVHNKTLKKGNFIGDLSPYNNLTKKHIDNVAYFASEQTDIGFINKAEYSKENIFKIMKQRMQHIFNQEQTLYYILQNIPPSTFAALYSPMITYKQISKGEKLFTQHSFYNGVYLLSSGEFEVSSLRAYEELDNLMILLQLSLDNYNEYISPLHQDKLPLDKMKELMHNPVYQSNEFLIESKEKRKIIFSTINNKEVIGLNEYYNVKNNLFHFTVECMSEVGSYYFINKDTFSYMTNREPKLLESVKQMVQLKVKYFIGTIDKYKKHFVKTLSGSIQLNKKENIFNKSFHINKLLISGFASKSPKFVTDKRFIMKMFANSNDDPVKLQIKNSMKFESFGKNNEDNEDKNNNSNDNEGSLSMISRMRSSVNINVNNLGFKGILIRKPGEGIKKKARTMLLKGKAMLKIDKDNDNDIDDTRKNQHTYNTINIRRNFSNNKIIHNTDTLPPILKNITRSFSNISKMKPIYYLK